MSQATSMQHPRPWILVTAFLIAVFGVQFMLLIYNQFIFSRLSTTIASWMGEFLGFVYLIQGGAFTGIAIWIASRSGEVNRMTFLFPCILTLMAAISPAMPWIVNSFSYAYQPHFLAFAQITWALSIRTIIHCSVIFLLICRATGIHLKPALHQSAPRPLTISIIMWLTGVMACSLAVDLWFAREASNSMSFQSAIMVLPSVVISSLLGYGTTSLLLFGIILLFIPTRTSHLSGWLLIGIWILASTASSFWYYLVMMPDIKLEIEKLDTSPGTVTFSDGPSPLMLFANIIITAFSTFVVVYLFHLAGYRWDRSAQRSNLESTNHAAVAFADVE